MEKLTPDSSLLITTTELSEQRDEKSDNEKNDADNTLSEVKPLADKNNITEEGEVEENDAPDRFFNKVRQIKKIKIIRIKLTDAGETNG